VLMCDDKKNPRLLFFSVIVMAVSFIWLKIVYPFPNFMPPDSYNYLSAADQNDFINAWPIGYSKFLRLVSSFSQSHMVLVILQYLLLITSLLYFLISIRYLLSPGKWLFRVLFSLSICNPLLPHIANFVSSDCLFISVSIVWITQLFWILYRSDSKLLLFHSLVLLAAFTIRFAAFYYPFISIGIILLANMPKKSKVFGIGSIVLLLFIFIGRTQYEYSIKTGRTQFSAFGGWLIAANALYGYAHSNLDSTAKVPAKFRELHAIVNHHMDSVRHLSKRPDEEIGIYYMWNFKSPLRAYMTKRYINDTTKSFFIKWAGMATLYSHYGQYLIKNHPGAFIKYFVWPNLLRFYSPPVYFMGKYNMGFTRVEPIAVKWFDWESSQLPTRAKSRNIEFMNLFSTISALINSLFLIFSLACVTSLNFRESRITAKSIFYLVILFWWANLFSSIFSAPFELRYELFPLIVTIPFTGLFIVWVVHLFKSPPAIPKDLANTLPEPAL
jgi:hypothetical protein